ncbi:MAG: methyl-accepting chemotaxis protein [Cyclobacteriaceae bacterium]|nr:PAS domain S-box protein [Cyclobacteriaceae bacterium]MCH8516743.1 methyl-accepting chemotaxis protein [Cyclobacteriaceae bacterium]
MALGNNVKKDSKDKLIPEKKKTRKASEDSAEVSVKLDVSKFNDVELQNWIQAVNNQSIVSVVDKGGYILEVNDLFCETSEYSRKELIGSKQNIVRHPDMPSEIYDDLWATITQGEIWRGEIKNKTKSGDFYWVDVCITPIIGEDGDPEKYIGVRNIITDQKVNEERIKSSAIANQLKARQQETTKKILGIFNNPDLGVEEILKSTANSLINGFASKIYLSSEIVYEGIAIRAEGFDADNILRKEVFESIDGKKGSFSISIKKGAKPLELTRDEISYCQSLSLLLAAGINTVTGRQILNEAQEANARLREQEEEIRQNMEELGAAQEASERESRKNKQILDGCADAILITDSTNGIIYTNPAAEKLWGLDNAALFDFHLKDLVNEQFQSEMEEGFLGFIEGTPESKQSRSRELTIKRADGDTVDCLLTLSIASTGLDTFYTGFIKDISDAKQQQNENRAILSAIDSAYAAMQLNPEGEIEIANQNIVNSLNISSTEELVGKRFHNYIDSENLKSDAFKEFWAKLQQGIPQSSDFTWKDSEGGDVFLTATFTPIFDRNNTVSRILLTAMDDTDFITTFNGITEFITELKSGNFETKFNLRRRQITGELAGVVTDLESLKDNLKEVVGEVNRVVKQAGELGNLKERLDITGVQGDWESLTNAINLLLDSVSEPILEISGAISGLAQGDLTKRVSSNAKGDLAEMSEGLNLAIVNLNELMQSIEQNAFSVASSSAQMLERSESMSTNTTEVSSAITQMAEGAQEQASRTDESSKLIEEIMRSARDMGKKSEKINQAADKVKAICNEGLEIIRIVVNTMSEINESAGITSNSIDVLSNRSEEISRTLNVITDIAAQTNLLALNAAIEAARAGDAGRGFAVVAEEIRKLAEDSRSSAVEIERVIKDVQKDTTAASKAIEGMKVSVKDGSEATQKAQKVFTDIDSSSGQTLELSEQVLGSAKEQEHSIGSVVKNIEKIVVVSEETAAGTQEIASSSRELESGMTEIRNTGQNLTQVAENLKQSVQRFKLK